MVPDIKITLALFITNLAGVSVLGKILNKKGQKLLARFSWNERDLSREKVFIDGKLTRNPVIRSARLEFYKFASNVLSKNNKEFIADLFDLDKQMAFSNELSYRFTGLNFVEVKDQSVDLSLNF